MYKFNLVINVVNQSQLLNDLTAHKMRRLAMKNLFEFMYYLKYKMVPLLQLRHVSTIILYYFKEKKLLVKTESKKENEKEG